jgi:sucrose-6-phosphate hydrolase SacC (GH32 family)
MLQQSRMMSMVFGLALFSGVLPLSAGEPLAPSTEEMAEVRRFAAAKAATAKTLYDEPYRPQFHFTAPRNWINDPNGLIYYDGEYHLMYQYNRESRDPHWNTKGLSAWWGHAVSRDLMHWEHLPVTSIRDSSGSGVVDRGNTAGFGKGDEDVLVVFHSGNLSYSRDRGRTWTPYEGNPILPKHADPYVFRYAPTKQWILVSFLWPDKPNEFLFYSSSDLRNWTRVSTYDGKLHECPSMFELPVEGEATRKWIFHSGNGEYLIGTFDGERVHEEPGKFRLDYGDFYASQCWHGRPPGDERTIQIAWMINGSFPADMPFNQQLTFPCELTLRRLPEGLRVCRQPVREIARLYDRVVVARDNTTLRPGENLLETVDADLVDLEIDADLDETSRLVLTLRGERIVYDPAAAKLQCGSKSAPLKLPTRRIRLRVLLDWASIELFADQGQVALTHGFLPKQGNQALVLATEGGGARIHLLRVRSLHSAWRNPAEITPPKTK